MFISVLIATRNRANSLRETLDSLFCATNLQSPEWEVMVVDNGSSDHTVELCREFHDKFPRHFRFLSEKKPGKSNALNTALAAATGDILAFIDDDELCAPDYLQGIRTIFSQYPADGVQGRLLLDCEGGRPQWLDDYFAMMVGLRDCGDKVVELDGTLFGGNMIVRAEAARKIGGFSPQLGPAGIGRAEDTEFTLRMRQAGYRLIYAPQVLVWHRWPRERLSKSALRKRAFQDGRYRAYLDTLPVSLWRFGLYVVRQWVWKEASATWHLCAGRRARALRCQCEVRLYAGFFWQYWCFKRGVPRQLSANLPTPSRDDAPSLANGMASS